MPRHVAAPSMAVAIIPALRHQRKSNGGKNRRHASKEMQRLGERLELSSWPLPRLEVLRSAKSR